MFVLGFGVVADALSLMFRVLARSTDFEGFFFLYKFDLSD